jgi:sucrose-phosphate synthase
MTQVRAFGECPGLRDLANLVLVMGNRDNLDAAASGVRRTLETVLKQVRANLLLSSWALFTRHLHLVSKSFPNRQRIAFYGMLYLTGC